ncbi:MAG TPA: ABC transporter ATP-binding protein, partial [Candidatus Agrococcus pullicola]|nr:ABC transporter ATP-binding protein [Candidatus Agrococcus pullicola]
MSAIRIERVSKTYPGGTDRSVDEMSLAVEEGDFLCLLGPSGCGKSTTLRMIAGLELPSEGRIEVAQRTVDDVARGVHVPAERRGLGFVFQNYALWPHMSVRENVEFGLTLQRLPTKERRERIDHALTTLSIAVYADRYPGELSGGQQQRVAIARTLAARPSVMLLDEPLSNLDARLRLEMRTEFQRIHRETGTTMVFVTHDQWEAMTLATHIAVMHEGRLQ